MKNLSIVAAFAALSIIGCNKKHADDGHEHSADTLQHEAAESNEPVNTSNQIEFDASESETEKDTASHTHDHSPSGHQH